MSLSSHDFLRRQQVLSTMVINLQIQCLVLDGNASTCYVFLLYAVQYIENIIILISKFDINNFVDCFDYY